MSTSRRDDPWVQMVNEGVKDRRRRARLTGSVYREDRRGHRDEARRLERREQARRDMASVIEWLRSEYVPDSAP